MTDLVCREAEFLLYQTEDSQMRIEVRFDGGTAWLPLGQMAELFQVPARLAKRRTPCGGKRR